MSFMCVENWIRDCFCETVSIVHIVLKANHSTALHQCVLGHIAHQSGFLSKSLHLEIFYFQLSIDDIAVSDELLHQAPILSKKLTKKCSNYLKDAEHYAMINSLDEFAGIFTQCEIKCLLFLGTYNQTCIFILMNWLARNWIVIKRIRKHINAAIVLNQSNHLRSMQSS